MLYIFYYNVEDVKFTKTFTDEKSASLFFNILLGTHRTFKVITLGVKKHG